MPQWDVFNGDADGLCALQQLRLAQPRDSRLVTGVKRDIGLLIQVQAQAGDQVTVLDIALDKNREALVRLLDQGVKVRYFDHHYPGDIPDHPGLDTHIDTRPDQGTSLLVDHWLGGAHRAWAVVGTFGDNFDRQARAAAVPLGLPEADLERLRDLGIYLNYNGYGASLDDLHAPPAELAQRMLPFADPLEFIAAEPLFKTLEAGYRDDMARAAGLAPVLETARHRAYVLPDAPWARRVSGVLANDLAQAAPERAHALLTQLPAGGFLVSVRAPMAQPQGADDLCRRFPSGGGRKAAAGINQLPEHQFQAFLAAFQGAFC